MHETLKVTPVLEDYLEAIFVLSRQGNAARSRDIAEKLGVHKSTVTSALKALAQMRLINYSPYEAVTLTEKGRKVAADVANRHETLKRFFIEVLEIESDMAEEAACGMEHAMPREIVDKLARFAITIGECRIGRSGEEKNGQHDNPGSGKTRAKSGSDRSGGRRRDQKSHN